MTSNLTIKNYTSFSLQSLEDKFQKYYFYLSLKTRNLDFYLHENIPNRWLIKDVLRIITFINVDLIQFFFKNCFFQSRYAVQLLYVTHLQSWRCTSAIKLQKWPPYTPAVTNKTIIAVVFLPYTTAVIT